MWTGLLPEIWQFTLGTDADGLLSQDNFVDFLSLSGDISRRVFVTVSKVGIGPVSFSNKNRLGWSKWKTPRSNYMSLHGSSTTPQGPQISSLGWRRLHQEEVHLLWHWRMKESEKGPPCSTHIVPRDTCPGFNHLASHQSCSGRVRLELAWLDGRNEPPNAFTTGRNTPLAWSGQPELLFTFGCHPQQAAELSAASMAHWQRAAACSGRGRGNSPRAEAYPPRSERQPCAVSLKGPALTLTHFAVLWKVMPQSRTWG